MSERMTVGQADTMSTEAWISPAEASPQPWELGDLETGRSSWSVPRDERSMETIMDKLVSAFLSANLDGRCTPLKEFMDDFEKRILHACLTLTQGHQRNAAAILGLKYTALFEKMRKHCINGRQMKLVRRLRGAPFPAEK
jgi:DNA-binding NtrC family response regulator